MIGHTPPAVQQEISVAETPQDNNVYRPCDKALQMMSQRITTTCYEEECQKNTPVKAVKAADEFSALWSYKVFSLKYKHQLHNPQHFPQQLVNLPYISAKGGTIPK